MSLDEEEVIQVSDSDDGTGILVVGDITGHKREREDSSKCCVSVDGRQNPSCSQKTQRARSKWLLSVPLQCDPQASNCLVRCGIEDAGSYRLVGPDSSHIPPVPLFRYEYYRQSSWNSKSAVTKFCFVCLLAKSGLCFNNPPCCQSICDKCTLELVRTGIDLHNSAPECAVRAPFIGGKRFYLFLRKALGKVPGSRGRISRRKKQRRKKYCAEKSLLHSTEPSDIAPDGLPVWRSLELSRGLEDDSESQDEFYTETRKRQKTDSLETERANHSKPLTEYSHAPMNKTKDYPNTDEHMIVLSDTPDSHECSPSGEVRVYTKQIRISGPSSGEQLADCTRSMGDQCKGNKALFDKPIDTCNVRTQHLDELSVKCSAPQARKIHEVQSIPEGGEGSSLASSGKLPMPMVNVTQIQRQQHSKRSECTLQSNVKSIHSEDIQNRPVPSSPDSHLKSQTPAEHSPPEGSKVLRTADRSVQPNPLLTVPVSLPRPGTLEIPASVPGFVIDILNRQSGLSVHGKGVSSAFKQAVAPVLPAPMVIGPGLAVTATFLEPRSGYNRNLRELILCSYGLMNMAIEPPLPSLELRRIVKRRNDAINKASKRPCVTNLKSLPTVRALAAADLPFFSRKWPARRSRQLPQYVSIPKSLRSSHGENVARLNPSLHCLRCRAVVSPLPGYLSSSISGSSQIICEMCCRFPPRLPTQHGASHLSSQTQINGSTAAAFRGQTCTVVDLISDDEDITQPCGKSADVLASNKTGTQLLPVSSGLPPDHEKGLSMHEMGKLKPLLDAVETAATNPPCSVSSLGGNQCIKSGVTVLVPKRKRSARSGGVIGWVGNGKEVGARALVHTKNGKTSNKCFAGCSPGGACALHNLKRCQNSTREKLTANSLSQGKTLTKKSRRQKRKRLSTGASSPGHDCILPSLGQKRDGRNASPARLLKSQYGLLENRRAVCVVPTDKGDRSNVQPKQDIFLEPLRKSCTGFRPNVDTDNCHRSSARLSKLRLNRDETEHGQKNPEGTSPGPIRDDNGNKTEARISDKGNEEKLPHARVSQGYGVERTITGSSAHYACPTPGIVSAVFGLESSVPQYKLTGSHGSTACQTGTAGGNYYEQSSPSGNLKVLEQKFPSDHANFFNMKSSLVNPSAPMEVDHIPSGGSEAATTKGCDNELMDRVDGGVLCPHRDSLVWKPAYSIFVQWSDAELQAKVNHIGLRGLVESLMKHAHVKLEDL